MLKVARFTLREVARKRLLFALALLTVLFLAFFFYGVYLQEQAFERRAREAGLERFPQAEFAWMFVVLMGLYMVNFLGSLVSVFSGVGSLSGELEAGTLHTVLTKPISRAEVVLGKWLGMSLLAFAYMALTGGGLLLGTWLMVGYLPPEPLAALGLMGLNAVLLLTLTLLGSSFLPTLTNGIGQVVLYGMGWTGGILGFIAQFTNTPLLERLSKASTWAIPTDALWRFASYYLQSPELLQLSRQDAEGNPFAGNRPADPLFLLWVGAYIVAALALAVWIFRKRDL
ncbi:ABC-2 family transporter protein [Calidithermus terrae]|uniref:ABC-2 family transporter protein n=1 Tax=Calidithermus terrae TaxID=1408545 RepID=A0A399F3Q8_9DEIN|nr:ABC transporter permease [Calidithermus terrae]RIH89241.1 ABC-2 family transporter protein [Calidithermus terrae]